MKHTRFETFSLSIKHLLHKRTGVAWQKLCSACFLAMGMHKSRLHEHLKTRKNRENA